MKEYIRKADIILLIVLVAVGLAASAALALHRSDSGAGAKVVIKSGGSVYATYPLSEDRTLVVPSPAQRDMDAPAADPDDPASARYDHYNVVVIDEGKVSVTEASCKNQVCVRRGSISMAGESIVCLPNRLVVTIEDGKGDGYDTITS